MKKGLIIGVVIVSVTVGFIWLGRTGWRERGEMTELYVEEFLGLNVGDVTRRVKRMGWSVRVNDLDEIFEGSDGNVCIGQTDKLVGQDEVVITVEGGVVVKICFIGEKEQEVCVGEARSCKYDLDDCSGGRQWTLECVRGYQGLSVEEARERARRDDASFRIVKEDGEPLAVLGYYHPRSVFAVVENGIVVEALSEGEL